MISKPFFNHVVDILFVSTKIYQNEIIIRTLLQPKHISLGAPVIAQRKFAEYFLPLRGGVSVDRYRYQNENQSKKNAMKKFTSDQAKYIGFAIFDINIFKESLKEYSKENKAFSAQIIATPLDINENKIKSNLIFRLRKGNLAHADIEYSENKNTDEVPNTSMRKFSKILAQNSKILLDDDISNSIWIKNKFREELLS